MSTSAPTERDPFDARIAAGASGSLRSFNAAGILSAADVHVARRLGALGGEDDETVLLAVALAVRAPRLGHVLVDLATIRATAAVETEDPVDLDALDWPAVDEWVAAVARSPLVAVERDDDGPPEARPLRLRGSTLYLDRYWAQEIAVARALRGMLDGPAGPYPIDEALLDDGLARLFDGDPRSQQALAAAAAVRRRFAVVAGGPGTGKTTTVARIVALLCEQAGVGESNPDARAPLVALAAPTGKAAARLQEAVHEQAAELSVDDRVREVLSAAQASTIHRLLGWRPDSSSRFRHNRDHRLPHDVVIIDETSMVSLTLMARLIEALRSRSRLVLVGDPGQLASIEAGAVLGDIVGAGAGSSSGAGSGAGPDAHGIVTLERGYRYGGAIESLAAAIRDGDPDAVIERLRADDEAVRWVDAEPTRPEAAEVVRAGVLPAAQALIDAARAGESTRALQALASFRILCAHRRGPVGVAAWTARVEGWLQEAVAGFGTTERFYVGRPLLVTVTDYELGLANGDSGVVVRGPEDRVLAAFDRGAEPMLVSPARLGAVETVYAMTIHKSQGSQFDEVAVLLPETDSRLLTRELLYTAATRARRRLVLIGAQETIRAAVARPVARASGLGARLWGDGRGSPGVG